MEGAASTQQVRRSARSEIRAKAKTKETNNDGAWQRRMTGERHKRATKREGTGE